MAQINKQPIRLGNRGIGDVYSDGGAVRGEGGPLRPHLIVPLTIELNSLPADQMMAVTRVEATLTADQHGMPRDALCSSVVKDLTSGFQVRSLPSGTSDTTIELRFPLTNAEAQHVELLRHESRQSTFVLYLGVEASVAGMRTYNQMGSGSSPGDSPWEMNYGMFSQLFPFWTCQITPVQVRIEQSTWIERVLPGLGYDRTRLLELTFPPPLADHMSAAQQFDKAKRALDERRYGDCIQECRGLLNMWEKQYGAGGKQKRLADVIAGDRTWPENDIRRAMLDTLWKEIGDVANAPHHPEGDINSEVFNERDARLVLVLTAALSEYVEKR
jgi:hypothetical protein